MIINKLIIFMCGLRELVSYVNNNNKASYVNIIVSKNIFSGPH